MIEDLLEGWEELQEHCDDYCFARDMYKGVVPEVFYSPNIQRMIEKTGKDYRFGLVATPVDELANRVRLLGITGPNDSVNQRISEVWTANDMVVWNKQIIKNTFMYGDSYVSVWRVDPQDPMADEAMQTAQVDITFHDPVNTRIIYDEQTQRKKLYAITRWCYEDGWRVNLVYPDQIERWVTKTECPTQASDWMPFLDPEESPDNWIQPVDMPGDLNFFHFRTDIPYGTPEHAPGYGCQNAITKMLVTQVNVADSAGWPERYKLTDPGSELDNAGDAPDWEDDAHAVNVDLLSGVARAGQSSALRGGPGTIQTFTGTRAVGEFAAAQPETFLTPAEFYIKLMATLTKTPLYAFDPSGDMPSGEALKTADAPLERKASDRIDMLRGPFVECWAYVLRLQNLPADGLQAQWKPTEMAIGSEDWAVVTAKQEAGVPQDVTLIEAGYDAQRVGDWMSSQAQVMDLSKRIALLDQVGDALTKLGTAAGLGVIDDAMVKDIVNRVLPAVDPATDPDPS